MKKFVICILIFILCTPPSSASENERKVDIDLSKLNTMMTYSTLFNIMTNPDNYIGKVIKIKGLFDSAKDPDTNIDYFAVVIMDASACCSSGLDFEPKKEYNYHYPADYPEIGSSITVIGKFERYVDGEEVYYHLAEADILK